MRTAHLFAGAGGGIYADLILGHRPVLAVEIDDYSASVLRSRIDDGWFPGLHLHHGDIRLFDPSPWAGRVDSIHAGFPCQDISVAGAGAGIEGERSGLWTEVVRSARAIRPRELFLENSPAITTRGLDRVLSDLACLGYDAEWCVLGAAAVGAPHLRARWWCLARRPAPDSDRNERQSRATQHSRRQQRRTSSTANGGENVANAVRQRVQGIEPSSIDLGQWTVTSQRADRPRSVLPAWWATEPGVGRVADGLANRRHRIQCLGNGQVPIQAAAAYMILDARYK